MAIYCIILQCKAIDKMLIDVTLQDGDITKCISFHKVDSQTKLGALHTNIIHNIDTKYEVLEGVKVHDVIFINEEKYSEQGGGKYSNDIIIIFL